MSTSNGINGHSTAEYQPPFTPDATTRAQNVGIHAMDVYFPTRCVSEADLEKYDGVAAGKYTIGLGQEFMAFTDDREDINSFLLTVVSSLMRKFNVDPRSVGRLDVGTETIIDKAKSCKTVLMDLFAASGNFDIEGIDSKNACYGGTAALFNCINWIESSSWDGRWAIVVAGDIATYAEGAARPAGGAGAVAMLIGPNAPIVVEPIHGTYMANTWDFYKPALASEYPEVDGPLTVKCYNGTIDKVYEAYKSKYEKAKAKEGKAGVKTTLDSFDYITFHGPYGKQVQKGLARLAYHDYTCDPSSSKYSSIDPATSSISFDDSLTDKVLEKNFINLTKEAHKTKVWPTSNCMRRLGNAYTASVYASLASLISTSASTLVGKRVGVFSYGSGLASSFFALRIDASVEEMSQKMDLLSRLEKTQVRPCQEFIDALKMREHVHNLKDWSPEGSMEFLAPGTYYLEKCDKKYKRTYALTSSEAKGC